MRFRQLLAILVVMSASLARGADEKDTTVDWLLSGGAPTTKPAITPTTRPATTHSGAPLVSAQRPEGSRHGVITLSDGTRLEGEITTTPGKPIRVWQEAMHEYADLPLAAIDRMDAVVLWERDEKDWHFVASGSDIKEYSGLVYPARETAYVVKVGEKTVEGGIVAPIYIASDKGEQTLVLHKRDKGPMGGTLKDLVYIKSVEFTH